MEGWAFYCEELMDREGFLDDPVVRLMRLNDQVWRACRVVIDVELHLGRMGLDEAVDFLAREASMNRREAELECRRYAEEPGQAMSYLLGKREVMRLAERWERGARRHAARVPRRAALLGVAAAGGDRLGHGAGASPGRGAGQLLTRSRSSAPHSTTMSRPSALAR